MALSIAGAIYGGVAIWGTWRFVRRPRIAATSRPSVTVLKPLHGGEPELYENLASFCAQTYAGPIQMIVGVRDAADPALDSVERTRRDHPSAAMVVVCDPTAHGTNRKLSNLINMSSHMTGTVVVISDSDVRLPPDGLDQIIAALEAPGVGLVHCLYRGRPIADVWSKLAALDANTRFIPSVLVGEALGANPCLGPTMALRADTLAQIGGLEHLADFLADDFELGRSVRAIGGRIALPPMIIDHVFPERSAGEMLAHELRWARTVRIVQPTGYLGSAVTHVTPLALIAAALAGFAPWSLATLVALGLLRQAQAYAFCRMMGADRSVLWLTPLRDVISFVVFVVSLFGSRVRWRGDRLRVGDDGVIAAT